MGIVLFDLAGAGNRSFSPNCWRIRMALAHKGLEARVEPTGFTEIDQIADGQRKTLPTIQDGKTIVSDSWEIACYLEQQYPERASLFGNDEGRAYARFMHDWVNTVLHGAIIRFSIMDIYDHLRPQDQPYFRQSREKRFGRALEAVQEGRENRLAAFQASLNPLRAVLAETPFLAGKTPRYVDYLVFGAFQWPRTTSSFPLLAKNDPLVEWMDRCLDLYDGLGRREPGYPWSA